mmetsp:Transcript_28078/g.81170  ORF Transcript_28078/g.81170 Transcript_28078/m.81170 type:complete len:239 (+) Transcript_28078:40-756(+)|eukprot:CAMPEP_0197725654 /NCGR_PEP_ID=MMETSP1434-20131217/9090_1 /TAXON_ID=265543 /ORGANISM="Minutocellus polymorphus, Strain CCMP3303" /LENGTH=238 /DNA_ID=CAMNT_0043311233 /DNA_START=44 /DNA_END=760 /DNA_ORIENTATION=+
MRGSRVVTTIAVVAALILAHGCTSVASEDDDDIASSPPPPAARCETEEDLDFSSCDLKHLSKEALRNICLRLGLRLEEHIFPILDSEIGVNEDGASEMTKYVWAAQECLSIEIEVDEMEDEDPEGLEALERAMLDEDPQLLADILAEVLEKNPDLLNDLEAELKREDPEHYQGMIEELSEGEALIDRPELVADLISLMLAENPDYMDVINEIDEDIAYEHEDETDPARAGKEELRQEL